ncbi:MAG: DUF2520 domain-containing protein [Proteobacteria bacterium]|nr:DUF2520 domain-containing protein [Pseudomonadota bacterium]
MSSFILVGPGRAGLSVAIALTGAGHQLAAVAARDLRSAEAATARLGGLPVLLGEPMPPASLVLIAVRDEAITPVAQALTGSEIAAAAHLSGLAGLGALAPLASAGAAVGSFHPLQTLPDPDLGARRLSGAWVAVDADSDSLRGELRRLAESIGAIPFDVAPEARATYHAAAAAAANFPLAALSMAEDLFVAAGVPFDAARPLVEAVIANAFEVGPRAALTGPVARGDAATVEAQLEAVRRYAPEWDRAFRAFVDALAEMSGNPMDVT